MAEKKVHIYEIQRQRTTIGIRATAEGLTELVTTMQHALASGVWRTALLTDANKQPFEIEIHCVEEP